MSRKESFWVRLGAGAIFGAAWVVGLLPHWFLYGPLARFIKWMLHLVVGYRLEVVRENLATSFPERSDQELRAIESDFYRNLAEYFLDAIDMASLSDYGLRRRCVWPDENRAAVTRELEGRNWVAMLAHFGSWEMMAAFGLWGATTLVAAYKPLRNRAFDLYYRRIRNRPPWVNSVPSNEVLRFFAANRGGVPGAEGIPLSVALIADQNPPLDAQIRWVPFLNHPTVFFHGGEKIARKFSLPVYYMRVRKLAPGRWEQTFEQIWDGRSPTDDYAITAAYAALLEEDIQRSPALWLWSHKRWKWRPEGDAAQAYYEKYGHPDTK